MWNNIKEWVSSKKTKALLTALTGIASALTAGQITVLQAVIAGVSAAGAYMVGQGLADFGKEAKKVETSMVTGLGGIKHGPSAKRKK